MVAKDPQLEEEIGDDLAEMGDSDSGAAVIVAELSTAAALDEED